MVKNNKNNNKKPIWQSISPRGLNKRSIASQALLWFPQFSQCKNKGNIC